MALQFVLEGLRRGERCLYVSFEGNPAQLAPHIRALGTDPDAAARAGLSILYVSPVELQIDSIIDTVFNAIREHGVRRVVIDAVGDLLGAASDLQRLHSYLYALAQHFAVQGVSRRGRQQQRCGDLSHLSPDHSMVVVAHESSASSSDHRIRDQERLVASQHHPR